MLLHERLSRAAANHSQRVALIENETSVTYAELEARANAVACALQAAGVARGDRVLTLIDNSVDAVVAAWAVLKAGGVLVALGPGVRARRLRYVIDDCTPTCVIAGPESVAAVAEAFGGLSAPPKLFWTAPPKQGASGASGVSGVGNLAETIEGARAGSPPRVRETGQIDHDLAAIIYTSGTTGDSKGVMLTHRNLVNTTGVISGYLGNTRDDVVCCVLPMWFSYGLCHVFCAPVEGYTLLIEKSFAFPMETLKRIERHRATGLPGVPTVFARLLRMMPLEGVDLSSLRYMTNAAAGIAPAHVLALREHFPRVNFFAMYGQTECTRATFLDPNLAATHPGSVGRAIANSEAFVVREDGSLCKAGEVGELVIRGANVMRGYWGKPDASAAKLRDGLFPGAIAGEKMLYTGDQFSMDERGLLTFFSRSDDVFKCRGEKVSPLAIENVLYEMPEIAEAAIVGIEDPGEGLSVKAFVVPKDGVTISEAMVRKHCNGRLDAVMVPRFVEMVKELPKTESGKLRRAGLKSGGAAGAA